MHMADLILFLWYVRIKKIKIVFLYRVSQDEWTKFGRVFLMLNYTDVTQNTYIKS